jgi:hypothetical protein
MIKAFLFPLFLSFAFLLAALLMMLQRLRKLSKIERCFLLLLSFGTMGLFVFSLPFVSSNMEHHLEHDYQLHDRSAIKQLDV